jgi:hypothetical protein
MVAPVEVAVVVLQPIQAERGPQIRDTQAALVARGLVAAVVAALARLAQMVVQRMVVMVELAFHRQLLALARFVAVEVAAQARMVQVLVALAEMAEVAQGLRHLDRLGHLAQMELIIPAAVAAVVALDLV